MHSSKNLLLKFLSYHDEKDMEKVLALIPKLRKKDKQNFKKLSKKKQSMFLEEHIHALSKSQFQELLSCVTLTNWIELAKLSKSLSKVSKKHELIASGKRLSDERISVLALEITIIDETVGLSSLAKTALRKFNKENPENKIKYLYQLVTRSEKEITSIKGLGPGGFSTVEGLLRHYELNFDFVIPDKDMKKILKKIKVNKKEKKRLLKESKKSKK